MGVRKNNQKRVKKEKDEVGWFFFFTFIKIFWKVPCDSLWLETQVLTSPQSIRGTSAFLPYIANVTTLT